MRCGLLGKKLGHSYSPQIHGYLADYSYALFEKEPNEIENFLKSDTFDGINVTIPYKKTVLPYCHILSDRARKLNAVNTVVRNKDGKLTGHNTDYFGFTSMLAQTGIDVAGKKVLVLGSGGASATAVAVLEDCGADVTVISRNGPDNYSNLKKHSAAALLVNTTPVGMYPNTGISPVDLNLFPVLEGVLDVIYNPARTQLLLDAEKRGLITENGLWMLVAQAKESAEWFTGKQISDDKISEIYSSLRKRMENIILVGMPGCGKSTIGKLLAMILGRQFVDADDEISCQAGMTIPDIFATSGEDAFRKIETDVLHKLGMESGLVIATGGGCVTRPENYPLLHQNGKIIWLDRSIDLLPITGRPLSQQTKLTDMYHHRKPLYELFSDVCVDNNCSVEETVNYILNWEGCK